MARPVANKKVHFSKFFHPTTWRPWWDFGCGGLGDIGCHTIDTPYWALDLDAPESVDVEMHGEVNPDSHRLRIGRQFQLPRAGRQAAGAGEMV